MSRATLAILHVCDSLFPVGSFAHSDGLESAVASGHVSTAADLREWMGTSLAVSLGSAECPAVRDAVRAASRGDVAALIDIDVEADAMRPSAAGRQATRSMGTRLLRTWQEIRPGALPPRLLGARDTWTFPVAFGAVCAAETVEAEPAIEAYCYARLAASVSAAMRLMPIGQHQAHTLLAGALDEVPSLAARVAGADTPAHAFAPLMDVATMTHQYVFSRLFRS